MSFSFFFRLVVFKLRVSKKKKYEFLDAFEKLHKAAVNFVMCVSPFTRNNWASTGRIMMKVYI